MWWRKKQEEDLERELRSHIELEAEERQDYYAARRAFGNVTSVKEEVREMWGFAMVEQIARDVRYALRGLRKSPGFAAAAAATLALGIGANTAMFSVVDAILLNPLPFPDPGRLIRISGDVVRQQASLAMLRDGSRTTDYAAYAGNSEFNFTGDGEPRRVVGSEVTANLFSTLGQRPLLGRTFQAGEDRPGNDRVVILSHTFWQRHFRGDPSVIGRSITIHEIDRRIVGVMPPGFQFPSPQTEIWLPAHIDRRIVGVYWWAYYLNIVGRLRPGFTREQAFAELRTFVPRIRDSFPPPWKMWPDWGVRARIIGLRESLTGEVRTRVLVLFAAVGLVLLIACANVANLLLARGASRHKEISVREALGASRARIVRQLLTESLLLAALGGAAGLGLTFAIVGLFRHAVPGDLPRLAGGGVDMRVSGFTGLLALSTGFGFGLLPALRFSKIDLRSALNSEGRAVSARRFHRRLSGALVAFEIAAGVVVVIGAGLLARSFLRLVNVNPGFRSTGTLTALVTPNPSLCGVPARCTSFFQDVLDRARALPGVEAAAAVNPLPLTGEVGGGAIEMEGHPVLPGHSAPSLWANMVTPDYFAAMGIPILRGRGFLYSDRQDSELVALVTAATARRWWPGENPIGKHLRFVAERRVRRVVGVAGDTREVALAGDPDWVEGHIYLPYGQYVVNLGPTMSVVLKTTKDPMLLAEPLRRLVADIRRDVPVTQVRDIDEVISQSVDTPRSTMWLLFSFAALALLLSAVGIYAVVAYTVAQRTREIGIRIALGARARDVVRGILAWSLTVASAGLALGIAGAWAVTRVLRSLLFEVTPHDTVTFIATPLLLLFVVLLAAYAPARRASRVDPMVALRNE
jgi:predicted permease